jgi:phospholipid-transporting ATPase
LPLCLINQFRRLANCYFLLIAVIQFLPAISPLDPWTGISPLMFVISISMLREAVEDYFRYRSDKETNSSKVTVMRDA